jgi:cell division transport system ATP-binding protein
VDTGEFVFLTGESGSAKSTLIKMLLKEVSPTGGDIVVNGTPLSRVTAKKLPKYRQNIGIVFQDFRLMPDLNVYDNIAIARMVAGGSRKDAHIKISKLLQLLGLTNLHKRLPSELSGGEQQRVCLARALVNNPSVLLADEPTANLDPQNSLELLRLFKIAHSQGISLIIATQDENVKRNAPEIRQVSLDELKDGTPGS